ncbi:LPXTG cell wall anchor domain-containing protein [Candidatus Woesearchaeota archaeon]|nr:LPXTG cell wall anchor domain-containing protein [Candidatus Woesearchaeota archaeon]
MRLVFLLCVFTLVFPLVSAEQIVLNRENGYQYSDGEMTLVQRNGIGPIRALNADIFCGTCSSPEGRAFSQIGKVSGLCGLRDKIPLTIAQQQIALCIVSSSTSYDAHLTTWATRNVCYDAKSGAACAAVGNSVSFELTSATQEAVPEETGIENLWLLIAGGILGAVLVIFAMFRRK